MCVKATAVCAACVMCTNSHSVRYHLNNIMHVSFLNLVFLEISKFFCLSMCTAIDNLVCCIVPCVLFFQSGYRSAIREAVPHLKCLDDSPLTCEEEGGGEREEPSLSSRSTLFAVSEAGVESDWRIVQESIKQSTVSMTQLDGGTIAAAVNTIGEEGRALKLTSYSYLILIFTLQMISRQGL